MTLALQQRKPEIIAEALSRFAQGEKLADIAQNNGLSKSTLYAWMLSDAPEEYRAIQTEALTMRLAETWQGIEEAANELELARARELRRSAQWDAERRLPRLFAAKQSVEHTHTLDMSQALADARAMLQGGAQSVTGDMLNAHVIDSTAHVSSPAQIEQAASTPPPPSDAG